MKTLNKKIKNIIKNKHTTLTTKILRTTTETTEYTEATEKFSVTTKEAELKTVAQPTETQTTTATKKTTEGQDSTEESYTFAKTNGATDETTKNLKTKKTTCKTVLEYLNEMCPTCQTMKKHFTWPYIKFNHTTQISKCTNDFGMIHCPNCGKKLRYNMQIMRTKPKATTSSEHYEFVY